MDCRLILVSETLSLSTSISLPTASCQRLYAVGPRPTPSTMTQVLRAFKVLLLRLIVLFLKIHLSFLSTIYTFSSYLIQDQFIHGYKFEPLLHKDIYNAKGSVHAGITSHAIE